MCRIHRDISWEFKAFCSKWHDHDSHLQKWPNGPPFSWLKLGDNIDIFATIDGYILSLLQRITGAHTQRSRAATAYVHMGTPWCMRGVLVSYVCTMCSMHLTSPHSLEHTVYMMNADTSYIACTLTHLHSLEHTMYMADRYVTCKACTLTLPLPRYEIECWDLRHPLYCSAYASHPVGLAFLD